MSKSVSDGFVFDLASYARRGPGQRVHFTAAQKQQIERTVGRCPEVMVKVLSQGAKDLRAVRRHLDYIGRDGDLDLETDDGQRLRGPEANRNLLSDWDLELDALRSSSDLKARPGASAPRLVHKLIFSMPAGTPPDKVLKAVANFCREEFALQHRYALALHTDEPHPHVHVVLKAVSEHGHRLNIRKDTLRAWREGFAAQLRLVGISANASPRSTRGEDGPRKTDAIYRAAQRAESTHLMARIEGVAQQLSTGNFRVGTAKAKLVATRNEVRRSWWSIGEILVQEGEIELAMLVRRFARLMRAPMTEQEQIASHLQRQGRSDAKDRSAEREN